MCSLRPLNPDKKPVFDRIMSILKKVIILTLCYQITAALSFMIGIFRDSITNNHTLSVIRAMYRIAAIQIAVVVNYSMFLMQQHNVKEYNKFLKILNKLKSCGTCICCICCRSSIERDMMEYTTNTATTREQRERTATITDDHTIQITPTMMTQSGGVRVSGITINGHNAQNTLITGHTAFRSTTFDNITQCTIDADHIKPYTIDEDDEYDSQRTTTSELDRNYKKTQKVIKRLKSNINTEKYKNGNDWK